MTKAELIGRVASKKDLPRDLTKKTVARIVDVVFTEIGDYFIRARPTRTAPPRFFLSGIRHLYQAPSGCAHRAQPAQRRADSSAPQSTVVFSPGRELKGLLNRDMRTTGTRASG